MTDDIKAIRDALSAGPKAWMRRWFYDGETPAKERNENGRMAWPNKFKFREVSAGKVAPDDVALFACHPERIARLLDALEQAQKDAALVRAQALEDAARTCQILDALFVPVDDYSMPPGPHQCAAAIRALGEKQ